jgi:hypothetical protein
METSAHSKPEKDASSDHNGHIVVDQEELAALVSRLESDENIQKLAGKLLPDWKIDQKEAQSPDLSYTKFEEKLRQSQGQ